jgi:hypothetical protein
MTHVDTLAPLIGEWTMEAVFPPESPLAGMRVDGVARTTFDYLPGRQFVVQRWEVPIPEAPDGIAIIRWDSDRAKFVQHYFDSRGVAREYDLGLSDGTLTLSRTRADVSPLDFAQRFTGTLSDDGGEIRGRWELSSDGEHWQHDFELNYRRVAWRPGPERNIDLAATARHIIDTNVYFTLSTADADGAPWASPVWYAHNGYREFIWASRPDRARHSQNIAIRPSVGIVIFNSSAPEPQAQGVYIEARAELVPERDRERLVDLLTRRSVATGGEAWTLADITPPAEHRLYRAIPEAYYVLGVTDIRVPVDVVDSAAGLEPPTSSV